MRVQVCLEFFYRLLIHALRPFIGRYIFKRPPKGRFRVHLVNQTEPYSSSHALFERRQHAFRPYHGFRPGPSFPDGSGLLSPPCGWGHCHRVGVPWFGFHAFHLPAPLDSTGIARLHRYYGRSDSWLVRLPVLWFPARSPWFTLRAFRPFRPQSPCAPHGRFVTLPLSAVDVPPTSGRIRASLSTRKLAGVAWPNRVRYLRTGRSPPVASHPASRQRGFGRIQAGERLPEGDFHPFGSQRSQAHG